MDLISQRKNQSQLPRHKKREKQRIDKDLQLSNSMACGSHSHCNRKERTMTRKLRWSVQNTLGIIFFASMLIALFATDIRLMVGMLFIAKGTHYIITKYGREY